MSAILGTESLGDALQASELALMVFDHVVVQSIVVVAAAAAVAVVLAIVPGSVLFGHYCILLSCYYQYALWMMLLSLSCIRSSLLRLLGCSDCFFLLLLLLLLLLSLISFLSLLFL